MAPRRIIFGSGSISKLPELVQPWGSPALLLAGGESLQKSGGLDRIIRLLRDSQIAVSLFSGVEPDPGIETVDGATRLCREKGCRFIIGVGGGSVIDCAKAVSGMATNGGSVREYLEGDKEISRESLPFVAIPTTAGTGAEATKNAVLTNRQKKYKRSIRHFFLIPDIALVDPELIEPYVSKKSNPLTDALALYGMGLVARGLIKSYQNGRDRKAREEMSLASLISGLALANSGLGLAHALSHPMGAHFGVPHGVGCAIMLPFVMEFNLAAASDKYARVARELGVDTGGMDPRDAARKGVEHVREIARAIGISPHLSRWGIKEEHLALIARESKGSSRNGNPHPAADEECVELLRQAL
jgi:alcohol dehydrogenase class IV